MEDDAAESRPGKIGKYANCVEVGYNEYEFLLEFGQSFREEEPPAMHTRIVTTAAYAKALSRVLHDSLEDYEAEYGTLPDPGSES